MMIIHEIKKSINLDMKNTQINLEQCLYVIVIQYQEKDIK